MFGEGMKYPSPDSSGEEEGEVKFNRINVVQECPDAAHKPYSGSATTPMQLNRNTNVWSKQYFLIKNKK
jgi:hypothetical protein